MDRNAEGLNMIITLNLTLADALGCLRRLHKLSPARMAARANKVWRPLGEAEAASDHEPISAEDVLALESGSTAPSISKVIAIVEVLGYRMNVRLLENEKQSD